MLKELRDEVRVAGCDCSWTESCLWYEQGGLIIDSGGRVSCSSLQGTLCWHCGVGHAHGLRLRVSAVTHKRDPEDASDAEEEPCL